MNQVYCTHCGSNKVKDNPIVRNILIASLLLLFIPVVGWITAPFVAAIAGSAKYNMKKKQIRPMKCLECKKSFQIKPDNLKAV
jgi:hypothetical protein